MLFSSLKNLTRGGQTFLHNVHMIEQVIKQCLLFTLFILIILLCLNTFMHTTSFERYVIYQWFLAQIDHALLGSDHQILFTEANGNHIYVTATQIIQSPRIQAVLAKCKITLIQDFYHTLKISVWILSSILLSFTIYGWYQKRAIWLRGSKIVSWRQLKRMIKCKRQASYFNIGKIPLIKNSETQHILIHGTVGSGKSVALKHLLKQVRDANMPAIIYDKGCDLIKTFYREGDVLLNPLDERSQPWNIWAECQDAADFDALSSALMPLPLNGSDPFWVNAARTIFAATAFKLQNHPKRSNLTLLEYLFTSELNDLHNLLKGTEAESLVSEKAAKTALSVKSVLATYTKSLRFLKDSQNPFSIKQWIKNESHNANWLFITSSGDKHETLKPLISTWLNTAANAILSLEPDRNRRLWLFLDELPTLHRLPYLPEAFAEARKFGGCLVAGMQSIEQMRKIYGVHAANEMVDLCNTRLFLRSLESQTAKWVSQNLGEVDCEEVQEGMSYGANSYRDGVSLSRQRITRALISPSEIESLPDLEGYLRLRGEWPMTKVKLTIPKLIQTQAGFVPRMFTPNEQLQVQSIETVMETLSSGKAITEVETELNWFEE